MQSSLIVWLVQTDCIRASIDTNILYQLYQTTKLSIDRVVSLYGSNIHGSKEIKQFVEITNDEFKKLLKGIRKKKIINN